MRRPHSFAVLIPAVLAIQAAAAPPPSVERSLERAGANRPELERVLEHYRSSGDAQKLDAAEFLIANMDGHGYVEHGFFTESGEEIPFDALAYASYAEALAAFEALEKDHGPLDYRSRAFHPDLETITADFLIENIDLAFAAWREKPWASAITYEAFREHLLPYRGSNEPLDGWRRECLARFTAATSELDDPSSLAQAGGLVLGRARGWVSFSEQYYLHPTDQGFSEMLESRRGRCEDMTNMMAYACRANAVMVAMDYTPWWANRDNNHAWEVLLDAEGRGRTGLSGRAAKVYRKMYSMQPDALGAVKDEDESVPRWLARKTYADVTAEYMDTTDVTVSLTTPVPDGARFAYLCVFNGGQWRAIHWGRIEDGAATFSAMGRSIAYLPAYFADETLVPAAAPFILAADGAMIILDGAGASPIEITVAGRSDEAIAESAAAPTLRVAPGATYELFTWDGDWRSLGRRAIDEGGRVAFPDVPGGRLYWLVADGSRRLERIFTVEDGAAQAW